MCDRVVSEDTFMLKYCLNRYNTQNMCDEAVNDCLLAIKFVLDWFITEKMIRNLHEASFTNDDILVFDKDFGNVTFFANEMDILRS